MHRNTFHTIQSAAPQGFYLGFNLRPRSTFALGEGRTGRGAMARVGWRRPGESCAFRFTGERERRRKQKQDKLLDSILQYIEDNEVGRKEGEVVRIEQTLDEKEEEMVSDMNSVDTGRRRGGKGRRRGSKRPKVRHLSKKQLRPNRREKNRRRKGDQKKSKRKQSMRSRPRQ